MQVKPRITKKRNNKPLTIVPAWKQASKEITTNYVYGDTIIKDQLCIWFNITFPQNGSKKQFNTLEFAFMREMKELKDNLLFQNNIFLHSLGRGEYKLIEPGDQTSVAWNQFITRFNKLVRITHKRLVNLNTSNLSNYEIANNTNKKQALSAIAIQNSKVIQNVGTKPTKHMLGNHKTPIPNHANSTSSPCQDNKELKGN